MGLGAIVVIGTEREAFGSTAPQGIVQVPGSDALLPAPLACVDILGRSMVERAIERFTRADVELLTVLVPAGSVYEVRPFADTFETVNVQVVADVFSAITQQLHDYSQKGIEHSFVASANVYTETDLLDFFYFHREARQTATRALDREGPLDLWVVDCARAQQADMQSFLTRADETGASYFIRDYVSRLTHPRDLRQLVSDALCGRCAMRPSGREIKSGIWIDEGAEIHRRARIVAPAFIGCGSKIQEDALITRCSSIEGHCFVDCGTVIEDSSILANTHIGIWLDVCHAVASGNKLMSLVHDVVVEIADSSIMRSNGAVRPEAEEDFNWRHQEQYTNPQSIADIQPEQSSTPKPWQLGANLIQG